MRSLPEYSRPDVPEKSWASRTEKIRVFASDDCIFVQQFLGSLEGSGITLEFVGATSTREYAMDIRVRTRPHAVVVDVDWPERGGHRQTRAPRLGMPEIQVLVPSGLCEQNIVVEIVAAGALGLLVTVDESDVCEWSLPFEPVTRPPRLSRPHPHCVTS